MWVIEHPGTMDFESYSEAGQFFDEEAQTWRALPGAGTKKSISAVGAAAYAEHPSTEVLTFSYKLPGDTHVTRWRPGQPNPQRLFGYLAAGGLIEAHNVMFERLIWEHVSRRLYGWPALPAAQLRCSMAKARVNSFPAALANLTAVLNTAIQKDEDGKRLLDKFSVPRKPTKKDPRLRIRPEEDPEDGEKLYAYCDIDVLSEEEASYRMMPLSTAELEFWQLDQEMNWRGISVDIAGINDMISILEQALAKYTPECMVLTGGFGPTQLQKIQGWLAAKGVYLEKMDDEHLTAALRRDDLPPDARRVLEIRSLVGSASVKKLYAMQRSASPDGRVRGAIVHHGARTGRPTGDLVQPLNLAKAGPELQWCECSCPSKPGPVCPWCGAIQRPDARRYQWPDVPRDLEGQLPIDWVMPIMATRSLGEVERFFGDALLAISGCLRGMLQAGPGKDLVSSDYSAIEAVVTAVLAGCQWRIDAFREGKDIYLMSCTQMGLGLTYEDYLAYKAEHGSNHPHRQKKGKTAELALGFGGWISAWLKFAPKDSENDIKETILDWRKASPEIVEMWGGQERGKPWDADHRLERFGFEGAFVNAVQYPGQMFISHGIRFFMRGDALIIKLLSDRELTYNSPRLHPSTRKWAGDGVLEITFETWDAKFKKWAPVNTYSGKIAENVVQATAHDIQRYGILALEAAGYPVVLHVYDEDVAEVPMGFGSIEEFEAIMARMPPWATGWPIRASGGWRGKRYRKA